MKIDAYCHIFPKEFFDRLTSVATSASVLNVHTTRYPALVDLDERFRQMDEFGEYRQVISLPLPPVDSLGDQELARGLARLANEGLAALAEDYPERFIGFVACLPLSDVDAALQEVEYAMGELGALGVQLYTHVGGFPVDGPIYEPLYQRMAEIDRPIWVHPNRTKEWPDYPAETQSKYEIWWVLGWPYDTAAFMARLVFSGHLERYENLKVITHHGGSMIPHFSGRVGPGWDQYGARLPDREAAEATQHALSKRPVEYFKMFYADTALYGAAHAVKCCVEFWGADRVVFASDSPFDPGNDPSYVRDTITNIEGLELSDAERRRIFSGNILELVGHSDPLSSTSTTASP